MLTAAAHPGQHALFVTAAPEVSATEAGALASRLFGIAGDATPLTSERDRNFRVTATDGQLFVLKVTNAAEDAGVTSLQTEALRHLERKAPGLPVPRACAALGGEFDPSVTLASGTSHRVRLLTYLPGRLLYQTAPSEAQAAALGRCLAEIGLALRDFVHPAADHDLLWDLQHAARLRALLPHVGDDPLRALAAATLDRFDAEIRPRLSGLRRQVVHNDLNPHNVLVDPDEPARVTGVLDFGDLVATPLINDVAIAASYQVEGEDSLARVAALVAAYHQVSPLGPDEIDSLFDLITMRQAMSVLIAEWRASLYPDNRAYILRNQPRAAAALEQLSGIGHEAASRVLRQACDPGARTSE